MASRRIAGSGLASPIIVSGSPAPQDSEWHGPEIAGALWRASDTTWHGTPSCAVLVSLGCMPRVVPPELAGGRWPSAERIVKDAGTTATRESRTPG